MKAVQATGFGGPGTLAVVDLPDPRPAAGQVAIDVTHAAVGLIDVFIRQGLFKDQPGMPQPPFIPGLEIVGTVRALGQGVSGFSVGEKVLSLSGTGTGGYASVVVSDQALVVSLAGRDIDPALAVAVLPNAAMAHLALSRIASMTRGESVLVHGALGGFAAAVPGVARQLGASRVVGSVRSSKLDVASRTQLPYDRIVDSARLPEALDGELFDVIVDPVGGELRSISLDLLKPAGRLVVVGNASGDWGHRIDSNRLWLGSLTVSGFSAGAYFPTHPQDIRPAVEAALNAVEAGLGKTEVDVLPVGAAAEAHERMESRSLNGRIVLSFDPPDIIGD
ncbi:NADPH quinone reductase [Mycobacterium sp. AT1]|nr:NADPH quinone reductase [Mycobacterium sp. AT1]